MPELPDLGQIKTYFDTRIQEHGASPRGSDWNGEESQNIRFDQILKVIEGNTPFSLLDYGCGYGALADYIETKGFSAEYIGFDILESAIETARKKYEGKAQHIFTFDKTILPVCDYTVSSGIFNYRAENNFEAWTEYILTTLNDFNKLSRRGFSSNFLTKYSDADRMRPDLYYADPLFLFDYCKRNFAKNVALLHDYRLYDFTIIVRKD
ncbi:MAG: methyltransferase domain-containing protein [Anaerolineales bacterium]|nr:methyltransferase domain-containing protein [Anaerolineales bacterium]MBK8824275.1 methyltransferase domain-containing protein [Anaerolineales bacterium]